MQPCITGAAFAHFRNGEVDRAIADYAEAIRLDPRATDAYYNRGRALLEKNAYAEAILDFGQTIAHNPKHPLARNGRAWALLKLGPLAEALDAANQAIAADSKFALAYDTRATSTKHWANASRLSLISGRPSRSTQPIPSRISRERNCGESAHNPERPHIVLSNAACRLTISATARPGCERSGTNH